MFVIQEIKQDTRKHTYILGLLVFLFIVITYFKRDVLPSGTFSSDIGVQKSIAQALLVLFTLLFIAIGFALIGTMRYYSTNSRTNYESTNGGYLMTLLVMVFFMFLASRVSFFNYTSSILFLTFIVSLVLKKCLKERKEKLYFEVMSFISLVGVALILVFSRKVSWLYFTLFNHDSVMNFYSLALIVTMIFILVSYRRFNFLLLKKEAKMGSVSSLSKKLLSGGDFLVLILEMSTLYFFGVFLFLDVLSLSACEKYREYFFPFLIFSSLVGFEVLLLAYEVSKIFSFSLLNIAFIVMLLGVIYIVGTGFFNYYSPFRRNR